MPDDSKISKAQQRAVHEYVKRNYDRIELTVKPKGKKDQIKYHADTLGETLNAFINRAINEAMERDTGSPITPPRLCPVTTRDARSNPARRSSHRGDSTSVYLTGRKRTGAAG